MANQEVQVLTSKQINDIDDAVFNLFAKETKTAIKQDLNSFKKQVDTIIKQMELAEVKHTNQSHKGWTLSDESSQQYAAQGYALIFKFRQYLLGEKINYRYYFINENGNVQVTTMTEEDILQFIKFGKLGLQINPTAAKKAPLPDNNDYQKYVNRHFLSYTTPDKNKYMQLAKKSPRYVVRQTIMNTYGGKNKYLRKKNSRRYQLFTKGHIFEALDNAVSQAQLDKKDNKLEKGVSIDDIIDNYVFGKFLAYDSIKASQRPDNIITHTQIKSGNADLYDYATIKRQLETISEIIKGKMSEEEIQDKIQKLFLHKTSFKPTEEKTPGQLCQAKAEEITKKLLKDLDLKKI